jgi:MSHA biogenesis protein MshM
MYEQYYGLSEKPFSLTPDTGFFVKTLTHQEALNVLLVALHSGDGFIKITGEVGTGKTLICRKLLQQLDDNYRTIYIPNPHMSCDGLLQAVVEEMGLLPGVEDSNYLSAINSQLIANAQQGRRTVILLDEAQSLPVESLEAIRLLSNLETEKSKLVQIVLFGQPELDRKLSDPSIRQLRQRIVHSFELKTLSRSALETYIRQRLSAAGYYGSRLFDQKALDLIFRLSAGVPRLVNLLCHKALLLSYSQADFQVTAKHIKRAAEDTEQRMPPKTIGGKRIPQAVAGGVLAVALIGEQVLRVMP